MSEVVSFNKQGQERCVTDRGVGCDVSGMGGDVSGKGCEVSGMGC